MYLPIREEPEVSEDLDVPIIGRKVTELVEEYGCPWEISLNALVGNKSGGRLRFQGIIRGKKVSILIDSGSTHGFVDDGIVKTSGLTAEMVTPLPVTVVDGTKVIVDSCCKEVQFEIQGNKFINDLRLFPLSNSDVILGVDWLRHIQLYHL